MYQDQFTGRVEALPLIIGLAAVRNIILQNRCNTAQNALALLSRQGVDSFTWRKTKEGHDYWQRVESVLIHRTDTQRLFKSLTIKLFVIHNT